MGSAAIASWRSCDACRADFGQSSGLDEITSEPGYGGAVRDIQFNTRGALFNKTSFPLQLDLVDGEFEMQGSYIVREEVPYLGRVGIGNFKEPFGLENSISLQVSPFLERSSVDGIVRSRGLGIEFAYTGLRVHADVSRDVCEGDMDAVVMRLQIDIEPESVRARRAASTAERNR